MDSAPLWQLWLRKTIRCSQKIIKRLVDAEGLAFARVGFLMHDRVGYQRRAIVGYGGGIDLVDTITNAIPDHVGVS
ncbi:hypothetical protein DRO03_10620 [Methanosarcinales archaeon]|nr:MAG: hypothetical protein DRO03_10620 [Methanosarcinales archaeon]